MRLPLIKGLRVDGNAEWRQSLPLNMTAFVTEIGNSPGYMRTLDGLEQLGTGFGFDRGGIWSDRFKKHLRVSANKLLELDEFGNVTDLSQSVLVEGFNQVNFAKSFNSIAFVSGGDYYRYDPSLGLNGLSNLGQSPNGLGYRDICQIDGYYILNDGESLWSTDINDETTINPISFAGSSFAPDDIIGVDKTTDNKLIAFNRYSTERFANNAGPQFPFARLTNAAIPIGIVGPRAKVSIGDGQFVVFGGGEEYSPTFYLLTNSYRKISTKEVDSIIDTYSDYELTNLSIEFRDTRDQKLVICHLPNDVLVYDITFSEFAQQNIWYRFQTGENVWRAINGVYDPRNVISGENDASGWVYGDKFDSRIGKLNTSICTQYGESLPWSLSTPLVQWGGVCSYFEVKPAGGHAFADSTVFLSTTTDGVIYGPEVMISAGKPGEYNHRIIHRRLGDYPYWMGIQLRGYSNQILSLANCEVERAG